MRTPTFLFFLLCIALSARLLGEVHWVANTNDAGTGSLREQITLAANGDTIRFDSSIWGDTILLTSGLLVVDSAVVIEGPGAARITIDNSLLGRHFLFRSMTDTAVLSGIRLIRGNGSGLAGSIRNFGNLRIECCRLSNNTADRGGAIFNTGSLLVSECTLDGNSALLHGGAIYSQSGSVAIDRCTMSGNTAQTGAAVYILAGQARLSRSTLAEQMASISGGALYHTDSLTLTHCLFYGNSSADSLLISGAGSLLSLGYNLFSDSTGLGAALLASDLSGNRATPLAALLDNLTEDSSGLAVHPLRCGSPAIDAGNALDTVPDQLGNAVFGSSRDIGSTERTIPLPELVCPADTAVVGDCSGAVFAFVLPEISACEGYTVMQTGGPVSGSLFPPGSSTIAFALRQDTLTIQTCSFNVQVSDPEAPVFYGGGAFEEQIALQGAGIGNNDRLGHKLVLEGSYAVAGAPSNDVRNPDAGAVLVYRRELSGWVADTMLTASDGGFSEELGQSVALSGNSVLAGAFKETRLGLFEAGAVYAYEADSTGSWHQTQKITVPLASAYDWLGYAVTMQGSTACISAPRDDDKGSDAGAVYMLEKGTINWLGDVKLMASDGSSGDWFGRSVALDGDLLVVGAHLYGSNDRGAAYVFRRDSSGWTEEARLSSNDIAAVDNFGWSVDVDDGRIAVGAFLADPDGRSNAGAVYVFEQDGGAWVQRQKLVPAAAQPGDFTGISLSLDGDQLLVGAYGADLDGAASGTAVLFRYQDSLWVEGESLRGSASSGQQSGYAVAIQGAEAALGAPQASLAGQPGGLIRFFRPLSNCGTELVYVADSGSCSALVEFAEPLASDDCDLVSLTRISGLGSGALYPSGETVNIYEALDASGQSSTCTITVRVLDQQAPIAVCDSLVWNLPADTMLTVLATELDGGSTDACGGPLSFQILDGVPEFSCPDLESTRFFTLQVSDSSGNLSTCQASLTLLNPYAALTLSLSDSLPPSAPGAADGRLEVMVSGGLPPYRYFWTTGDTTAAIDSLVAGLYGLTVYDAQCQVLSADFALSDPEPPACVTDTAPQNLSSEVLSNGVVLRWEPVAESVGCRVKGRPLFWPVPFKNLPPVLGLEPDSAFIPKAALVSGSVYVWKVQCTCTISPISPTPFSVLDTFFTSFGKTASTSEELRIWPVPAQSELNWSLSQAVTSDAWIRVVDVAGREYFHTPVTLNQGINSAALPLRDLAEGMYWLELRSATGQWRQAFSVVLSP